MHRRLFIATSLAAALPGLAHADPQPSDILGAQGDPSFLAWLNGFYARQLAVGFTPTVLATTLSGVAPDPRVLANNATQPEFARPISVYIETKVTAAAAAEGRRRAATVPQLHAIGETYGVTPDVLVAIWAMETGYGAVQGNMDVVRSLATLAAEDPRRSAWAETQLVACLKIIQQGLARRDQLKGSWAGAMGQTQFEPSGFLTTAVSASGAGKPDIWGSSADALASAANELAKAGWKRGESWGAEVLLPAGFDYSLSEGPKQNLEWWRQKGVKRASGQAKTSAETLGQLILPCGASGPAFLVFPNHFVIRSYNNSLAYALTIGLLADRIAGAGPLATPWPKETPLSLEDRMAAQTALAKLGYNPGPPDGMIGLGSRQAIRAWQKDHGLPADGYLSPAVVAKLKASPPKS